MDEVKRIAAIYERLLEIPKEKHSPQFYIVPVGLIGSGKTTVLSLLCKRLHLLRVSGDEIRKVIKDSNGNLDDTWAVGDFIVRKYASQGYSIAHDTDGATIKTQESIAQQAAEFGVKVIWLHVNPPEEAILSKLKNYKHTWLFKDADEAIAAYFRRKPLHENLQLDFTYVFDTSKSDIESQVDEAVPLILKRLS